MQITILGTRGNIESSSRGYSKRSGLLVDGRILLDAGEKMYFKYHPTHVFITHLHPDHAAIGAGDVPKDTVIYVPEPCSTLPKSRVISRPVRVDGYTITPVPTVHSEHAKSVGYVVEKNRQRFFYSSDLVNIRPRFHDLLKDLSLVITEGSFIRSGGLVRKNSKNGAPFGHNGIPDLVRFFSRFTAQIVITHFGTWFFRSIYKSRKRIESLSDGVKVLAARDGMSITVEDLH